jgi:hypothetical protein
MRVPHRPALSLRLLFSNGAYGDIMPRVVGLFMFVLGGVIVQFVRARDYRYYLYIIVARCFIVLVMTALYFKARPVVPCVGCYCLDRLAAIHLRGCAIAACKQGG